MSQSYCKGAIPPLVLDCGSCIVKAGFGGGSAPKITFSNVIGSKDQVRGQKYWKALAALEELMGITPVKCVEPVRGTCGLSIIELFGCYESSLRNDLFPEHFI